MRRMRFNQSRVPPPGYLEMDPDRTNSWWSAPDACSMGGGVDPVEFSGGELTVVPELDADPWRSGSLIILC